MVLKKYFPSAILFFGVLVLYIHNLSRSTYGGDVGDLISAASLGGVAHPPGYPLFSFLGFLLTRFTFIFPQEAFLVGLISAISGALGVLLFYYVSQLLTRNKLVSLLGAFVLAFSFLYWFYSEIAEVFALNAFFALLLFFLALLYRKTKQKKVLYAFFFSLGLSFTNHQTIILIVPSLILLIEKNFFAFWKKEKKPFLFSFLFFLLGSLPYLYIPIASSLHPVINWDNVHDIPSFLQLVLRKDYGTFSAGVTGSITWSQRVVILQTYLQYLLTQLTIPVVICSLIGFILLLKKDRVVFVSFLLAFLLSGPFFVAYAGFPLVGTFYMGVYERFFLLSSIFLLIPFPIGVLSIASFLSRFLKKKSLQNVFLSIFFLIPIILFFYNFGKTNLSTVFVGDIMAYDMLSPLPPNSILVLSGDTIVFNTWYVHYVKKFRPDILIYNIGGGLEGGPFNKKMIAAQLSVKTQNKIDALLAVLAELRKTHRIFSTVIMQPSKGKKITWIPYGLSYAYINADIDMPPHDLYLKKINNIWSKIHPPTASELQKNVYHNVTIAEFPSVYSNASLAVGTYLYSQYHDDVNALVYYKKAQMVDPTNPKSYLTLGVFYTSEDGKCADVISNLSTAISLDPLNQLPYFLLYNAYTKCSTSKVYAESVKMQFIKIFQEDFFTALKKQTNL